MASTTVTVATATLAISPTGGPRGGSGTIALTGTNTLWSSETASGLFGLSSSVSGALDRRADGDLQYLGDGDADLRTAAGTDVVKDASTTATANFTVNSGPGRRGAARRSSTGAEVLGLGDVDLGDRRRQRRGGRCDHRHGERHDVILAGVVLSVGDNKGNTYTPLYNATQR